MRNAIDTELLSVGPFGGYDPTTPPYYVAPTNFPSMSNIVPNTAYGGFATVPGRVSMLAGLLPSQPTGIGCLQREGQADVYLFACESGGVGAIYHATADGVPAALSLPAALTPGLLTYFVPCGSWVFVCNGTDTPLKIDTNLNVTYWGIVAPDSAPTLSASGSGNLVGTYYYCETFSNSVQESSQGVISAAQAASSQEIVVTPTATTTDPQVTTRNIYRIGGASGTWTLVHSQAVGSLAPFTDNIADSALTGQALVIFRDPPQAFTAIALYQDRIFGFGPGSQVAWSNYNEPWGFNFDTNTQQAGYNQLGDVAVTAGAPNAEMLLLLKTRSYFLLVGNSDDTFQVIPGENVGCISPQSLFFGDGLAMWASNLGAQMFSPGGRQNVGDTTFQQSNIKAPYDALSRSDKAQSVGFYWDKLFCLSFPTKNATYGWDLRSQQWYPLGFALSCVYTDTEADIQVVGNNLNNTGEIDQWFASTTDGDLGNEILGSVLSRITDCGMLEADKAAVFAYVEAPIQNASVQMSVIVNPGLLAVVENNNVSLNVPGTLRHRWELPLGLEGQEFQIGIQTQGLQQVVIHKAALYGHVVRAHKPAAQGDG